MRGRLGDRQRWTVPLSLAVSFLANDGEEFLTLVPTWPDVLDRLPVDVSVPSWVRDVDQCHVNVGIAMMGALCAAAVADGVRSRGRGSLYQDFQWVFGLHGFGHIAAALVFRRYATGVASSPIVVIPQLGFALRALRRAGVPHAIRPVRALARIGAWLALSHAAGAAVSAARRPPLCFPDPGGLVRHGHRLRHPRYRTLCHAG